MSSTAMTGDNAPINAAPIEVRNLSKQFKAVPAVSEVSFAVQRGSITGFLGPNGSGKSTTLRMLLGLSVPTSGSALIEGVPFAALSHPGRTIGAVLDAGTLHPKRTAIDHIRIYAPAIGVPDARAEEVLRLVGLDSVRNRKIGAFSLGMRQRLTLATALLGNPRILVLDEPSNGLDPEGIAWLRQFLEAYAATGGTVLISSHLLREIEQIVTHLLILSRGSLVYQGRIEDLRATQHSRLLVASSNPPQLAVALAAQGVPDARSLTDGRLAVVGTDIHTLERIASAAEITLFGVVHEQVDLEQLFLAMTAPQYVAGATSAAPGGYGPPQPVPPPGYPGAPSYPGAGGYPGAGYPGAGYPGAGYPQPQYPAYAPPPGYAPAGFGAPSGYGPPPGSPQQPDHPQQPQPGQGGL